MARTPFLLAVLAAIMLLIGGTPLRAAPSACNPCPPDCPMMKHMAASSGEHHKAPDTGGKAHNPCKQGLACQISATMTAPSQMVTFVTLTANVVDHQSGGLLAVASHPPDRSLRPPIQL
jgi:hypothetical protein